MKCRKAYAIMPVGKKDESAHCGTQKAPEVATPGLFYSVVARWLIQRATKLLEKQSDTLTSVMKQKIRELEESKNSFFRYEGLKLYLFWGGMVCNILVFLMLASSMFGK